MTVQDERIESILSQKRVKRHVFEPSNREIWTIVGMGEEYWLNPKFDYCSCPGFYFGKINGKKQCYHLESVMYAQKQNKVEIITFSDDEYDGFIAGLISEL